MVIGHMIMYVLYVEKSLAINNEGVCMMGPGYYAFILIVIFAISLPVLWGCIKLGKGCFSAVISGVALLVMITIYILLFLSSCS